MNIKQLKPSKTSRFSQGYINPDSCKKYIKKSTKEPIIYRSSYEKKFIRWCESCSNIKQWGSEEIAIPYLIKNEKHMYYPDYIIIFKDDTKALVEVKPYQQTVPPKHNNINECLTYQKNICKWRAAKKWCEDRNIKFVIITEKFLNTII